MSTRAAATAATPKRRRTQAERRASSKRRLLDATAEVISAHGTTNVSFAEIAKVAECSHGLPGYLFGSKNNLLLAMVDDVVAGYRLHVQGPAAGDKTGLDSLLAVLRATMENFARFGPHTTAIYVLLGEAPGLPDEVQAAVRRYQVAMRDMLSQTISQGIDEGDVRPDVDPETAAVMIFGTVRGVGQQILLDRTTIDIPAVTDMVVDSIRRALAPPPPPA